MANKQTELPGVGRKQIAELEDKALELRAVRSQRQKLGATEEVLQGELKDMCKLHKITKSRPYVFETEVDTDEGTETIKLDVMVEKPEERAYVRKHKDPKADEDEEGTEEESQA